MKKIILILLSLVMILCGCVKETTDQNCQQVYELSDKYTRDSVFIRTDTLKPWGDNNIICGKDLMVLSNSNPSWQLCDQEIIEYRRYVIGNKITYAKTFN